MKELDQTKRAGFRASLLLHGLALVAALAIPWACSVRAKRKPPEPLEMVQIPISVRTVSMPEPPALEPSQPVSITEPVKEPVPKPDPKPSPKPKPVEKQTNRVTKTKAPLDPPRRPEPLTEEGIKQILTADMPASGPVALEAGENDPVLADYYRQVYERMYAAWRQPAELRSLPGLSLDVRIVVEPDGKITGRTKIRGSGNELMDESAMKAVQSVKTLPPLPREYRSAREIVVTFELGG